MNRMDKNMKASLWRSKIFSNTSGFLFSLCLLVCLWLSASLDKRGSLLHLESIISNILSRRTSRYTQVVFNGLRKCRLYTYNRNFPKSRNEVAESPTRIGIITWQITATQPCPRPLWVTDDYLLIERYYESTGSWKRECNVSLLRRSGCHFCRNVNLCLLAYFRLPCPVLSCDVFQEPSPGVGGQRS